MPEIWRTKKNKIKSTNHLKVIAIRCQNYNGGFCSVQMVYCLEVCIHLKYSLRIEMMTCIKMDELCEVGVNVLAMFLLGPNVQSLQKKGNQ